jgi:hypothetical protein
VAGNTLAEQKKRFTIPPMAIIAGVVVLVGLAGFWYLDRASRQGPTAATPPTPEARAYAKNLKFVGPDGQTQAEPVMESHESYLKQSIVEISGNLLNAGDRALSSVEVTWIFYEPGAVMPDGRLYKEIIWRERRFLILKNSGGLAPGQAKPFKVAFDNIPDSWNQAMPNLVIAAVEFK